MNNPFNNINDKEFSYQMCAFMGKDNFIRLVEISRDMCPNDGCDYAIKKGITCGQCFYDSLHDYERLKEGIQEGLQVALSEA